MLMPSTTATSFRRHHAGLGSNLEFGIDLEVSVSDDPLAFFKAVLTLPGIAGIVLTLGMAVDANILINERIREERRAGRSPTADLSEKQCRVVMCPRQILPTANPVIALQEHIFFQNSVN